MVRWGESEQGVRFEVKHGWRYLRARGCGEMEFGL